MAYKEVFGLSTASSRDTRALCRQTQLGRWKRAGRLWTSKEVIQEIRECNRQGKPLAASQVSKRLYGGAIRRFGNWTNAVRAAGLDPASVRVIRAPWTKSEVIEELRNAYRAGEIRYKNRFHLKRNDLFQAAIDLFGSWRKALEAARIPRPARPPEITTIRQVQERIVERARKGLSLRATDVHKDEPNLYKHALRLSGKPWAQVVIEMGLPYPEKGTHRKWDKHVILEEIRRRKSRGEDLSSTGAGLRLRLAARRFFGSWRAALQAGGVDPVGVDRRRL